MRFLIVFLILILSTPWILSQTYPNEQQIYDKIDSLIMNIRFIEADEYFKKNIAVPEDPSAKIFYDKYKGFLNSVTRIDSQMQKVNIAMLNDLAHSLNQSYKKEICGVKAATTFAHFTNSIQSADLKQSYAYFLTARFFGQLYIRQDKIRLIHDYDQSRSMLHAGAFQQVLERIDQFEKHENRESSAYKDIGDSLNFLYAQLKADTFDSLRAENWWKPKEVVEKKWNVAVYVQFGLMHRNNKEVFDMDYSYPQVIGQMKDPLLVSLSLPSGYFLTSKLMLGIKPFYGMAFNRKVNIGEVVTKEFQIKINSQFYGSSIFSRYYFRNRVGARPYIDAGIGIIWTEREKGKLADLPWDPGNPSTTAPVYIKETNWQDAFIDFEFGIDYSQASHNNNFYSLAFQIKILLDEDTKIYNTHYAAGLKFGLLFN